MLAGCKKLHLVGNTGAKCQRRMGPSGSPNCKLPTTSRPVSKRYLAHQGHLWRWKAGWIGNFQPAVNSSKGKLPGGLPRSGSLQFGHDSGIRPPCPLGARYRIQALRLNRPQGVFGKRRRHESRPLEQTGKKESRKKGGESWVILWNHRWTRIFTNLGFWKNYSMARRWSGWLLGMWSKSRMAKIGRIWEKAKSLPMGQAESWLTLILIHAISLQF